MGLTDDQRKRMVMDVHPGKVTTSKTEVPEKNYPKCTRPLPVSPSYLDLEFTKTTGLGMIQDSLRYAGKRKMNPNKDLQDPACVRKRL